MTPQQLKRVGLGLVVAAAIWELVERPGSRTLVSALLAAAPLLLASPAVRTNVGLRFER